MTPPHPTGRRHPAAAPMDRHPAPHLRNDDGWILVPALILMTVVLALGFALLMVVDRQTSEARAQRTTDAAQALSDGVASSTAKALASFDTLSAGGLAAAWPRTGACRTPIRGDLTGGQEPVPNGGETAWQAVERNVRNAVRRHFDENGNEYVRNDLEATKWSVVLCPDRSDGSDVWSDAYLGENITVPSTTTPRAVWIRAQADVRATAGATASSRRSRATAVKVRQVSTPFAPEDLAIGAASFSTDLGTSVTGLIQNNALTGGVLQGLLGQAKLIEGDDPTNADATKRKAKIGLRCGLLDVLENTSLQTCVSGTLGALGTVVGGTTDMLSLSQLGSALQGILGTDRTVNLGDYAIAPDRARATFKALALDSGTYVNAVGGNPANTPPAGQTSCFASATTNEAGTPAGVGTLTAGNTAGKVVYIRQVGDGGTGATDPFCTLPDGISPAVLVIERGGARVRGAFTGVLYAANRQEIDGATTPEQIAAKRKSARLRETIRIEQPGKVTGAVWTDGAGGQAGLYPTISQPSDKPALLNIGGPQGVCSLPIVGPVVNLVGGLVGGVLTGLGNVLTDLLGTTRSQTETRYPGGAAAQPSGCALLKQTLGGLASSSLINLFGSGGNVDVVLSESRTRSQSRACSLLCSWPQWSDQPNDGWSAWGSKETKQVNFGVPLLSNLGSLSVTDLVNQVLGALQSTLSPWTAVERSIDRIRLANVGMAVGSENVPGTYRSIPPSPALVQGGI